MVSVVIVIVIFLIIVITLSLLFGNGNFVMTTVWDAFLTTGTIKNDVFCNMMPCSLVSRNSLQYTPLGLASRA